jgi:glycosyltransferase involved in cell wall biosynthesis
VAGDGSLRQPYVEWVESRGLADRIRVTGYLTDLWSWMKRANCFLSTSAFEGQPNVVLEAMACGCPLVVSDIAQHREFLDERAAALADVTSAEAFVGAVESVMRDPEAAQARARAAANLVAQWSVASVAAQYDALYREVMD